MILHSYLCNTVSRFFIKIERTQCFSTTYSEIESTWSINSSKEEIILSHDSNELFLEHFVLDFDQDESRWKHEIKNRTNFIKKRPQHVSCRYGEILRLPILKIICERLLLDCFIGSLLYRPICSRSILYDSVRVQGPNHRTLVWADISGLKPSPELLLKT